VRSLAASALGAVHSLLGILVVSCVTLGFGHSGPQPLFVFRQVLATVCITIVASLRHSSLIYPCCDQCVSPAVLFGQTGLEQLELSVDITCDLLLGAQLPSVLQSQ
jgi:hypothetical protein